MKKSLIISIFICISLTALSQNNYPLLEEGNSWNVMAAGVLPFFDTVYSTVNYKISGDTIINSISYKKLYSSWEEIPDVWNLMCFMREDSSSKVWLINNAEDEELLMYDFSIDVGDSVQVGMDEPVTLVVDSVTLITIAGTDRQKYWFSCFDNPYYQETWIEGIGSDKGLIWSGSAMIVGGFYRLLCLSKNEELLYMNPNYNVCYINTVGIDENISNQITIYPVPANNILFIKNVENIELKSITIADQTGRILMVFNKDLTSLDISALTDGIYILKVSCNGGEFVKKILVN